MKKNLIYMISIILFQLFVAEQSCAQLMTNSNIAITINAGAQITVQGDIQNQNGASISNNGIIDLSGNWINNAANNCFGASAGAVIFNGANQTIGGSNSTLFNNLSLQGTGLKTLLLNTTVGGNTGNGVLNIGNRNLILNSNAMTVTNSATGAIAFTTGFITSEQTNNSSKVEWDINSVSGPHVIPFGTSAGVQIPFIYNLASGNAGRISVSTYPTAANNAPLPSTPITVTHVRNNAGFDNSANTVDRFWEVDQTGAPTATLTFTWAAAENAANGNISPRAQRWIAPSQVWQTPLTGQSNPTTQSVTVPNVSYSGLAPWAIALEASPLPIELISFSAQVLDNNKVECKWTTASEINNDYFTIERSTDGHDFEKIGTVDGAGNSSSILNYAFIDQHPYNGISYYRLKQTDFNGQFSYSKIVSVQITSEGNLITSAYPNPFIAQTRIRLKEDVNIDLSQIQLTDALGRSVIASAQISMNNNEIQILKNNLKPGLYYLSVFEQESGNRSIIRLIVK